MLVMLVMLAAPLLLLLLLLLLCSLDRTAVQCMAEGCHWHARMYRSDRVVQPAWRISPPAAEPRSMACPWALACGESSHMPHNDMEA